MGLSLGLRPGLGSGLGSGFNPLSLGEALHDLWDVERPGTLSLSSSTVTEWRSVKQGLAAAQAVGASRPIWSDDGLNGRPCLMFDGADDELVFGGVGILPVGDTSCEIWMLVRQDAGASDATSRYAFAYGGGAYWTCRGVRRNVVAGVNRAAGIVGDGAAPVAVFAPGDHLGTGVVRIEIGASQAVASLNGARGAAMAAAPATTATGNVVTRIGAATPGTLFFQGAIAVVAVTAPLDQDQAGRMTAWLKQRGGLN